MKITFGRNLKELRLKKNLTQEMLADFLGVSFQAVSKWEREDSFPDITMLPAIASFFGVSLDSLLGLDLIERENKIKKYCDEYRRLWSEHKICEVRDLMKKATTEFPGNFELLSKYFNALIKASFEDEYRLSIKAEAERVYDSIQNCCTDDSIRIWTKKIMCRYLRDLSMIDSSGVDISDAEKILAQMPIMQNTRDYEAMFMYPYDEIKRTAACASGTSEILYLLGEIINRRYSSPLEYNEKIIEAYVNLIETIIPDGDYGKCYHLVIYDSGYIGVKKYLNGNTAGALEYFEKMCRLAVEYDNMPEISVHTSESLKGLEFDKAKMLIGKDKLTDRVKHNMLNNYPLSDEFKASKEFKKIIDILG